MFDKITKVQKSRLQLKTLAAIFGVLAVLVVPTLYSPKAAADAINDTDFVFTVDTRKPGSSDTRFVIPTRGNGYNYTIDCNNDGTVEATAQTGSYTCSYATPGVYTIRIGGVFPEFYLNNSGDKLKMISIDQWGKNKWRSLVASFYGAANMDVKAIDTPDLSQTDSIYSVFRGNTSLKGENANWNWNTSTITNMGSAFSDTENFNQNIGSWDVSNVVFAGGLFNNATAFNNGGSDSIKNWNTGKMTAMNAMFQNAVKFNQPIGSWDVSKAELMSEMFNGARAFNQSLANWRLDSLISTTGLPNSPWSGAPRMLDNSGLSMKNYDAILISWNARSTNSPLILGAAGLKYCAANAARANLIKSTVNGGHGWTINGDAKECPRHTVVFDVQGGTAIANQEVAYTGKIIEPAAPTRKGYTFAGWYADTALTRLWDFASYTMPDNNLTLYAKWTKNPNHTSLNTVNNNPNSSPKPAAKLADTGVDMMSSFSMAAVFVLFGAVILKRSR